MKAPANDKVKCMTDRLADFAVEHAQHSGAAARALELAAEMKRTGVEPVKVSRAFFIELAKAEGHVFFSDMDEMQRDYGFVQAGAVFGAGAILYEIGNNGGCNFEDNHHWQVQIGRLGLAMPNSFGKGTMARLARHINKNYPTLADGLGWGSDLAEWIQTQ